MSRNQFVWLETVLPLVWSVQFGDEENGREIASFYTINAMKRFPLRLFCRLRQIRPSQLSVNDIKTNRKAT